MKLAFAGKGGVGKTTLTAWTADWLARQGHTVWMIDADTALSLGEACGLSAEMLPTPVIARKDLIQERIHSGSLLNLNPDVDDLPEALSVEVPLAGSPCDGILPGTKRLLVMGTLTNAGGGCACDANALLKALLATLVIERNECVLVDLEAGVEHLGRGTVTHVDGLIVVSEPSKRSMSVAAQICTMAHSLGLSRQTLALNRVNRLDADPYGNIPRDILPALEGLPQQRVFFPLLQGLVERQLESGCVLNIPEQQHVDRIISDMINHATADTTQ